MLDRLATRPPASPANGGICPAGGTSSAPTRSARCSRRWACGGLDRRSARAPLGNRRCARASRAAGDGRRARGIVRDGHHCAAARSRHRRARSPAAGGRNGACPALRVRRPARERRHRRRRTHGQPADAFAAAAAGWLPHAALRRGSRPHLPRRRRSGSLLPAAGHPRWRAPLRPRRAPLCAAPPRRSGHRRLHDAAASAEATARAGGSIVGINPLHALFAEDRERASPYHPSDRRFLDPLYIDVDRVPDLAASDEARALLAQNGARIAALSARTSVDYTARLAAEARGAATRASRASSNARPSDPLVAEFDRFVAAGGAPLRAVRAVRGHRRRASARALARVAAALARARRARHRRFRARACAPGPFRAVPAMACGPPTRAPPHATRARAASRSGSFAISPSAPRRTAPRCGRIRPPSRAAWRSARRPIRSRRPARTGTCRRRIPRRSSRPACAGFRDLVAANMRHAGALRIDHVMGLSRLFWIPDGARGGRRRLRPVSARRPARGAGDRERPRALPRRRRGSGHSARGLPRAAGGGRRPFLPRALVRARRMPASSPPSRYPAKAAACVSTHDLPTIAGWWTGADIAEKHSLGLLETDDAADAQRPNAVPRSARSPRRSTEAGVAAGRVRSTPTRRTTPRSRRPFIAMPARRRRRWCCSRPMTSPAKPRPSTSRAPTSSGRTGDARSASTPRRCGRRRPPVQAIADFAARRARG